MGIITNETDDIVKEVYPIERHYSNRDRRKFELSFSKCLAINNSDVGIMKVSTMSTNDFKKLLKMMGK